MRRVLPLITALAVALGVLASLAPANAAARPTAPWISGQSVQGGTVSVTLDWDPAAGASSYQMHWTASYDSPFDARDHQASGPIAGTHTVVTGLRPSTTYCFALTVDGQGGPRGCKVTPPLDRAVRGAGLATTAATFNLRCGSTATCNGGWKWRKRQRQVVADIDRMNADIMVFVEGHVAHKYGKKSRRIGKAMAKRGYTLACRTQKSRKRKLFSQTAYVRTGVYAVVDARRNSSGSRFTRFHDRNHGYCHALIQHRATGRLVAIGALHLRDGDADGLRQQETAYVLGQVQARFGATPTILLGDFNSHRALQLRNRVDTPRNVLEAAGFADASDIAAHLTYPYLNSAHGFKVDPPQASAWPTHVDRIFVSAGITVPSWENIAVLNGSKYATPMASDHNPIKATLYIP